MPSLLYSAVYQETTLLCEATVQGAAFMPIQDMTERLQDVLETSLERQSYPLGPNVLHFLVDREVYLVLVDSSVSKEVAFGFLLKVKEDLIKTCGELPGSLLPNSLDKKFKRKLSVQMKLAETNPGEYSKIEQVKGKITEVKKQMEENVKKAVNRGEKLEDLQVKAEGLEDQAAMFKKRAKDVQVKERWKYFRTVSFVIGIFLVLGVVIWLSICRGICIN